MDEFEFPTLPSAEELQALSDDDLAALHEAFVQAYEAADAIAASPADIARLTEVVDQIESLRTETERRVTVAAEVEAGPAALGARVHGAGPDPDPPAQSDQPPQGGAPPQGDQPPAQG